MRAVVQRVSSARVAIAGETVGEIGLGLLVLLGIAQHDTEADGEWLAHKIAALRIFEDEAGKMNRSLLDLGSAVGGALRPDSPTALVVSQFTLLASTAKGTRPSFNAAAPPVLAVQLYEKFVLQLSAALGPQPAGSGVQRVATGRFGAMMDVSLVNSGPVTISLDSKIRE